MLWDKITAGFDPEDQTANFGTRSLAECDGSVFEASTLASIEAGGEVTENPHVIAALNEVGGMCVAVDKSMTVFSDHSCTDIQLNIAFESVIDSFAVSPNGAFLFVGVRSGDLYCLHIPTQGKIVFAKNLISTNESFKIVQIFCHYKEDDLFDVMVLCNQGQIYRMKQFDVKSITGYINEDCDKMLSEMAGALQFEQVSKGNNCKVSTMDIFQAETEEGIVFGGQGIGIMSDFSSDIHSFEQQPPLDAIKKIQLLNNKSLLVVLSEDSELLIVCPFTLLCLKTWKELQVQDFVLLPQTTSSGVSQDILMLTKSEDGEHSWLQLASLPNFNVKLRLKVSSSSYLVALSTHHQELLYLEGIGSPLVDTIHIKILVESMPIDRFERILRRKKFDEAEKYANLFKLDVELVYKARATQCLEDLDPWTSRTKDIEASMTQLLAILDKIQDIQFLCELCMCATLADLNHVRRLLTYASQRLKTADSEKVSALTARVCAMEFRLETFEINNDSTNFEAWLKFAKSNLLHECIRLVKQGHLHQASFLWTRHFYDFKNQLTPENSITLLYAIPVGVSSATLLLWLSHVIPSVLTTVPQILEDVIQWAMKTTREMEGERSSWPESALECALHVLDLMKVGAECDIKLSFFQQYSAPGSSLHQLIALIKAYKQLKTLKTDHFIRIPLKHFMDENKAKVVTYLLDTVTVKNLHKFSVEFLGKFIEECGLDSDVVLSDYIQSIVRYTGSGWDQGNEAPWEETVSILLPQINKYQHVMESIIAALKSAPVPWSARVNAMAEHGLKLKHPLTKEIRHQRKLISVKIILGKYNFKRHALEKCDFRVCISHVRHIIKQGLDCMLEDCLQLCDTHPKLQAESYRLYFEYCIEMGKEDEAFQMLDKLEPKAMEICMRKVIYKLSCNISSLKADSKYVAVLDAIAQRLEKCVQNQKTGFFPLDNLIEDLKNLHKLQEEFKCHMTGQEYASQLKRSDVLKSCTEYLVTEGDLTSLNCCPQKLATVLKFVPEEGAIEFVKQAVEKECIGKAIEVAQRLCTMETLPLCVDKKLHAVIVRLMQVNEKPLLTDIAKTVNELSCFMCAKSGSERVLEWLTLFTWSGIVLQLMRMESKSDRGFNIIASQNNDRLDKWTFSPIYFDPTVYSDKTMAITLIRDVFQYEQRNIAVENLQTVVRKLQEENHDLTALKIIHTVSEHLPCADTGRLWLNSVRTLLQKVILARTLDTDLGLGLLSSLSEEEAHRWLNDMSVKYLQDLKKLNSISNLGLMFHKRKNLFSNETLRFAYLRKQCLWTKRVIKLGVSPSEAFSKHVKPVQVLQQLMSSELVTVDMIKDFCVDFDLDVQEHLLLYLQTIILKWEPHFELIEDSRDNKVVVVKNDQELSDKCLKMLKRIDNKSMVYHQLEQLWEQINYYNYETYLIVYELMDIVAKKQSKPKDRKLVLVFLTSYIRTRQPDRSETELWMEAFPHACGLPAISKYRLPFHQFLGKDVWSVVKPEVNLDTYETWLKVAPLIGLQSDLVCSVAIRQTVGESDESSVTKQWSLHIKDNYFVKKIHACVERLTNPEMASGALYHVVRNTPPGIDQANVATLCYKHAQLWEEKKPQPDVFKCVAKVQKTYLDLATSHVLHLNGLGQSTYLKLTLQPKQLIRALFNDPSVIARGREATMFFPNINDAVDEISTLHGLNATKLRQEHLAECLKLSLPYNGALDDDTCTNVNFMTQPDPATDENNLLKACYILEAGDLQTSVNYLTSIAFGNSLEESSEMQLRALKCLTSIASETTLSELTGRSLGDISNYMQSLHYVVQLSRLGASYSMSGFESSDKLELMKMIWQSHSRNPQALVFMTQLCFDYRLFQIDIWDSILMQMTQLKMMHNLEVLLPRLTEHKHILNSPGYIRAWDSLLISPFSTGDVPLTDAQESVCIQRLILLQSCPVLSNVNLTEVVVQCVRVHSCQLGATLLPYMRGQARELNQKVLLNNSDASTIIDNLKNVIYKELLTVPKTIQILEDSKTNNNC